MLKVFDKLIKIEDLKEIVAYFDQGWGVEVSDMSPVDEYIEAVRTIPGMKAAVAKLGPAESPALMASNVELILEGLHLHQNLDTERRGGRFAYHA